MLHKWNPVDWNHYVVWFCKCGVAGRLCWPLETFSNMMLAQMKIFAAQTFDTNFVSFEEGGGCWATSIRCQCNSVQDHFHYCVFVFFCLGLFFCWDENLEPFKLKSHWGQQFFWGKQFFFLPQPGALESRKPGEKVIQWIVGYLPVNQRLVPISFSFVIFLPRVSSVLLLSLWRSRIQIGSLILIFCHPAPISCFHLPPLLWSLVTMQRWIRPFFFSFAASSYRLKAVRTMKENWSALFCEVFLIYTVYIYLYLLKVPLNRLAGALDKIWPKFSDCVSKEEIRRENQMLVSVHLCLIVRRKLFFFFF